MNMYDMMPALGAISFNTNPTSDWNCSDWKFWHEELVKAFMDGKFASKIRYSKSDAIRLANQVFNTWWDKISTFYSKHQFCGYETGFYNYFKSVGLDNILSYFQAVVTPVAEASGNVATNAATTVTKVSDAAANTAKVSSYLVPALVIGVVGAVGYYAYKNYLKGNRKVKIGPATL